MPGLLDAGLVGCFDGSVVRVDGSMVRVDDGGDDGVGDADGTGEAVTGAA
ncbi:hypothetical protein [Actinoplanes sp. TFC3]|nr:hypothetical protein [Actinoplanes sp. TFC3]